MRKLFVSAVLTLVAAAMFAQEAPKPEPPRNEIYGAVWLDYDASGARFSNPGTLPVVFSDFSFSRTRLGLRNTLSDGVKTWFEFDPRNLEFRQVNVDWSPVSGLDLIAGKQSKLFAQQNDWVFGDRTLGIQARSTVPGLGWAGIIVGNDADITNLSSKKLGWEGTANTSITGSINEVNPGDLKIYPQITARPDLGDIGLEVGVNAEINATKMTLSSPTGSSLDAYALVSGFGASLAVEYTFVNFNDSNNANQDHVLYTRLAYNAGVVVPTLYFVVDNLAGNATTTVGSFKNNSTPNATIMVELPVNATKDLVIDPFFSYGVTGYNLMEYYVQGYSAADLSNFPKNDWTAGLRIKYSISTKW